MKRKQKLNKFLKASVLSTIILTLAILGSWIYPLSGWHGSNGTGATFPETVTISSFSTNYGFQAVSKESDPFVKQEWTALRWKFLGLDGKRVETLRLSGDFVYACTDDGIYRKSINSSDTIWTPIGLQGKNTKALLVINPDIILASVRISGLGDDTVSLFRTTNGGTNWQPFQNGFGGGTGYGNHVLSLDRLPHQSDTIFATGTCVIAKSTDGGLTWRVVWGGWDGDGPGTHFVKVDPNYPNIVWAGGEHASFAPYLLKSTDSGESWQYVISGVGGDNACYTIAIDPSNSDVAYVGMEGSILKTSNGGIDWSTILMPDSYPYFFGIAINPHMPTLIYAAGAVNTLEPQPLILYKSEDSGSTWSSIRGGSSGQKIVNDLLFVSYRHIDKLYLATGDGVYQYIPELF